MRAANWRRGLLLVSLAVGIALSGATPAEEKKDDEGFTRLFNGKDFTGWKTFLSPKDADPDKTWSVQDGAIICTGHPAGYFYTEKPYHNYVLRYDWKYVKPPEGKKSSYNSGCLVHIQKHKVWPKCVEV